MVRACKRRPIIVYNGGSSSGCCTRVGMAHSFFGEELKAGRGVKEAVAGVAERVTAGRGFELVDVEI